VPSAILYILIYQFKKPAFYTKAIKPELSTPPTPTLSWNFPQHELSIDNPIPRIVWKNIKDHWIFNPGAFYSSIQYNINEF